MSGYRIVKIREPVSQRMGLLFTVSLPEIKQGERPRRRFMSAFEQKREVPNRAFQYFVVRTFPLSSLDMLCHCNTLITSGISTDIESIANHLARC